MDPPKNFQYNSFNTSLPTPLTGSNTISTTQPSLINFYNKPPHLQTTNSFCGGYQGNNIQCMGRCLDAPNSCLSNMNCWTSTMDVVNVAVSMLIIVFLIVPMISPTPIHMLLFLKIWPFKPWPVLPLLPHTMVPYTQTQHHHLPSHPIPLLTLHPPLLLNKFEWMNPLAHLSCLLLLQFFQVLLQLLLC